MRKARKVSLFLLQTNILQNRGLKGQGEYFKWMNFQQR